MHTCAAISKLDLDGLLHRSEGIEVGHAHRPQPDSAVDAEPQTEQRSNFGMCGDLATSAS